MVTQKNDTNLALIYLKLLIVNLKIYFDIVEVSSSSLDIPTKIHC